MRFPRTWIVMASLGLALVAMSAHAGAEGEYGGGLYEKELIIEPVYEFKDRTLYTSQWTPVAGSVDESFFGHSRMWWEVDSEFKDEFERIWNHTPAYILVKSRTGVDEDVVKAATGDIDITFSAVADRIVTEQLDEGVGAQFADALQDQAETDGFGDIEDFEDQSTEILEGLGVASGIARAISMVLGESVTRLCGKGVPLMACFRSYRHPHVEHVESHDMIPAQGHTHPHEHTKRHDHYHTHEGN